ncbi:hypothetical protein OUZ56_032457 [Daphnia magna]|uniref:NAD-dependent epimerase/dehydratase domain-containing protein n=1 Tax=Daphnia magna TaxID=35525 RepID=A0ABR0B8Z2_9CRUS|nr:hypothetical protein OUZ56_032457 [Daphnia magna]
MAQRRWHDPAKKSNPFVPRLPRHDPGGGNGKSARRSHRRAGRFRVNRAVPTGYREAVERRAPPGQRRDRSMRLHREHRAPQVASEIRYHIDTVANVPLTAEFIDGADIVYHLAAAVGVKLIVESPVRTIETNIRLTEVVLEQAAKKKRPVFVASTSEVYGKSTQFPFREDGDLVMGSTNKGRWSYACSKAIDEFLAIAYFREKKLPTVVGRLFNTVGPRQTGMYGMVVPNFVIQGLQGKPITVFGDGTQSRCFTHVKDVVRALAGVMETDKTLGEVYNFGNDHEITITDLAKKVRDMTGGKSEIVYIPYDKAYEVGFEDMHRRVPCIDKHGCGDSALRRTRAPLRSWNGSRHARNRASDRLCGKASRRPLAQQGDRPHGGRRDYCCVLGRVGHCLFPGKRRSRGAARRLRRFDGCARFCGRHRPVEAVREARLSAPGGDHADVLWKRPPLDAVDAGQSRHHGFLACGSHQRPQPARQHRRPLRRHRVDCRIVYGVLLPHDRPRWNGGRARVFRRRNARFLGLQFSPGVDLYGRFRVALSGLSARRSRPLPKHPSVAGAGCRPRPAGADSCDPDPRHDPRHDHAQAPRALGFPGGRDHTSHRLVALGLSERDATLTLYGLAVLSGICATVAFHARQSIAYALIPAFAVAIAIVAAYLGRVKVYAPVADENKPAKRALLPTLADFSYKRRIFEVIFDFTLILLAYYSAFLLRFDGDLTEPFWQRFSTSIPVLAGAQMALLLATGLYGGLWRYTSLADLRRIFTSSVVAALGGVAAVAIGFRGLGGFSRAVFIVDGILLFLFLAGLRVSFRVIRDWLVARMDVQQRRRVIIYGAGDAGELLLREIRNNGELNLLPVGFVDDDPQKEGVVIHGLRVLGSGANLANLLPSLRVQEIVLSTGHMDADRLAALDAVCEHGNIKLRRARIDWH